MQMNEDAQHYFVGSLHHAASTIASEAAAKLKRESESKMNKKGRSSTMRVSLQTAESLIDLDVLASERIGRSVATALGVGEWRIKLFDTLGTEIGKDCQWSRPTEVFRRAHRSRDVSRRALAQRSRSPSLERQVIQSLDGAVIEVFVWPPLQAPTLLPEQSCMGHTAGVYCMASLPGGGLVTGSADRTARLWDATGETQQLLGGWSSASWEGRVAELPQKAPSDAEWLGHTSVITAVIVIPSCASLQPDTESPLVNLAVGPRIVTASMDGSIRVWNEGGCSIGEPMTGHKGGICCLAPCAGAGHHAAQACAVRISAVVSGGQDNDLRLWTLPEELVTISSEGSIKKTVIAGSCSAQLEGHKSTVYCITTLAPMKNEATLTFGRMVSGSGDKTLRVWNNAGECEQVLQGHTGPVTCVVSTASGKIVSASSDKSVRIWRSDSALLLLLKCLQCVLSAALHVITVRRLIGPVSEFARCRLYLRQVQ